MDLLAASRQTVASRVLIVDDDEYVREVMGMILEGGDSVLSRVDPNGLTFGASRQRKSDRLTRE
jgi:CheY-like chemotaxis protein